MKTNFPTYIGLTLGVGLILAIGISALWFLTSGVNWWTPTLFPITILPILVCYFAGGVFAWLIAKSKQSFVNLTFIVSSVMMLLWGAIEYEHNGPMMILILIPLFILHIVIFLICKRLLKKSEERNQNSNP